MATLLDSFAAYLQHERQYSPLTVEAYTSDLAQLGRFVIEAFGYEPFADASALKLLTAKQIRLWLGELAQTKPPTAKRTLARKISALRHLFRYARRQGWVTVSPVQSLDLPKAEHRLPIYAREADTEQLFSPQAFTDDLAGTRERLVLELLYGCGLRRAELISLTWAAIDLNSKQLRVLGKGRKERIVPFGVTVLGALEHYRQLCALEGLPTADRVILTDRGQPAYPQFIYSIVHKRLATLPGLAKASPHVLRHSYATHLVDRGADLNAVKELLGHASLATTQIYVHTSAKRLHDAHQKAHPRAEDSVGT